MQRQDRRVLVTGGAGFIGSQIVAMLLADGWQVAVVDDLSGGNRANLPPDVSLFPHNITGPSLGDAFAGARYDAIIHCAAQTSVPRSVTDPAHDREVNLVGTENLLRLARATGAGRFVFFSSGGAVYGDTAERADEHTLPAPLSPYGVHKLAAEGYVALSGIPYAILRPANVYGPRQRIGTDGGVVAIFLDHLRRRAPLTINGDGLQVRDFVYVADVAAAACAALTLPESGVWNIASGTDTTINDLATQVGAALGVAPTITYGPSRAGDVYISRLSAAKATTQGWWQPRYTLAQGIAATVAGGDGGR